MAVYAVNYHEARSAWIWPDCPVGVAPFLFFDIETTGLRPDRGAQITEVAVLDRSDVRFAWNREQDGSGASPLSCVLPPLFDHLHAGVVVGHNLNFDLTFVSYEAARLGYDGPALHLIDTLALARKLLKVDDHRLETLLRRFDIAPAGNLHTAVVDAEATRALFWKLVDVGAVETLADAGIQRLDWSTF